MKKNVFWILLFCLVCVAHAGSERPKGFIRFHVQVSNTMESSQAIPIQLEAPPQQIWIKKYAELSEESISNIEMIEGGKVLVTFNESGRIKLEETTSMNLNRIMVVILGTGSATRVVYAPVIDTVLREGKFLLPAGVSEQEVKALQQILKYKQRD